MSQIRKSFVWGARLAAPLLILITIASAVHHAASPWKYSADVLKQYPEYAVLLTGYLEGDIEETYREYVLIDFSSLKSVSLRVTQRNGVVSSKAQPGGAPMYAANLVFLLGVCVWSWKIKAT